MAASSLTWNSHGLEAVTGDSGGQFRIVAYEGHRTDTGTVFRCSNWKNPPLEKTLPFTGAQSVCLEISNSEGGAQKNGYYHSLSQLKMYVPDLKPICDLDLNTV